MTSANHPVSSEHAAAPNPRFAARLSAHRSMPNTGYRAMLLLTGLLFLVNGLVFLAIGAWPVLGFLGLDLFLLWFFFKLNYRAGRAYEEIAVWPHDLVVRQVSPEGKVAEHRFNPFWTRFKVDRHEEFGITKMTLATRERELSIGAFLSPLDRESFATAFGQALASARRG